MNMESLRNRSGEEDEEFAQSQGYVSVNISSFHKPLHNIVHALCDFYGGNIDVLILCDFRYLFGNMYQLVARVVRNIHSVHHLRLCHKLGIYPNTLKHMHNSLLKMKKDSVNFEKKFRKSLTLSQRNGSMIRMRHGVGTLGLCKLLGITYVLFYFVFLGITVKPLFVMSVKNYGNGGWQ